MRMLKGEIASPGIAIGKAFLYEQQHEYDIDTTRLKEQAVPLEIKKFDHTVNCYVRKLQEKRNNFNMEVLDAHIGMVTDPFLTDQVHHLIQSEKIHSEYALAKTLDIMIEELRDIEDPLIRERYVDYIDLKKGMLDLYFNKTKSQLSDLPKESIIIAKEINASDLFSLDVSSVSGLASVNGTATMHSAILAQSMDLPFIVGVSGLSNILSNDTVILDGMRGELIVEPDTATLAHYRKMKEEMNQDKQLYEGMESELTVTKDGDRQVAILSNVTGPEDLHISIKNGAEGVGLFRTEFLFMSYEDFPSEEQQFKVYKQMAESLKGRPFTIRVLDIGSDKQLPYTEFLKEENPSLGWRGIRYALDHRAILKTQLMAVNRVRSFFPVRILLPMITSLDEILEVKGLIKECEEELIRKGKRLTKLQLGIMVETPASVFGIREILPEVDFVSIGTNDLTQYMLAVDRQNKHVNQYYDIFHPFILKALKFVIDEAHCQGKKVSVCGEFASDEIGHRILLGFALDEFSVMPNKVKQLRYRIRNTCYQDAVKLSQEFLNFKTQKEIHDRLSLLHKRSYH